MPNDRLMEPLFSRYDMRSYIHHPLEVADMLSGIHFLIAKTLAVFTFKGQPWLTVGSQPRDLFFCAGLEDLLRRTCCKCISVIDTLTSALRPLTRPSPDLELTSGLKPVLQ